MGGVARREVGRRSIYQGRLKTTAEAFRVQKVESCRLTNQYCSIGHDRKDQHGNRKTFSSVSLDEVRKVKYCARARLVRSRYSILRRPDQRLSSTRTCPYIHHTRTQAIEPLISMVLAPGILVGL